MALMRFLFICSRNRFRSPTAEAVFADEPGIETASAGTAPDADCPVTEDLIQWADLIFAMETAHRNRLQKKFPEVMRHRKIEVLGIRDDYTYMDTELVDILKRKMSKYIRKL